MDDYHVGKHCSDSTCRQKDWLPIKCKYCLKYYCADHYSIQSHSCSEHGKTAKKVFQCPLCNKVIPVNLSLSVEENFQVHEATECQKNYQKNVKKQLAYPIKRCRTKLYEYNTYTCKNCRNNYCMKHRMQEEHQCNRIKVF